MTTLTVKNEYGEDFCRIDAKHINWIAQPSTNVIVHSERRYNTQKAMIDIVDRETSKVLAWVWPTCITWLKFPARRDLKLDTPSVNQENHPLWPATRMLYLSWVQQVNADASESMINAIWEAFAALEEAIGYETGHFDFTVDLQVICNHNAMTDHAYYGWEVAYQWVSNLRRNLLSDTWKRTEQRHPKQPNKILRGWADDKHHFVSVQQVMAMRHLAHIAKIQSLLVTYYPA